MIKTSIGDRKGEDKMNVKLALDINEIIYRIGDKIALKLYNKEELVRGEISGIFKSVHPPCEIRINLKELPIYVSIGVDKIECIYKVY